MSPHATQRTRTLCPRRKSLWRLLWALVLLIHVPATVKVFAAAFGTQSGWSSAILIAATNLFFILEISFVWSLHLLSDRRSVIAFLLIVALLHVGVIERGVGDWSLPEGASFWMVLASGGLPLSVWLRPRVLRRLRGLWTAFARPVQQMARLLYDRRIAPAAQPIRTAILARTHPERAPPIC